MSAETPTLTGMRKAAILLVVLGDEAASAVKKASDKVVDKSKDLTHQAGKAVEKGGKRMQDV